MILKSPPLGQIGAVPDLGFAHRLPVGAWLEALNVRFDDGHVQRIDEPDLLLATVAPDATWLQLYDDDLGPRAVYGSPTKLYRLSIDLTTWEDVTRLSGDYSSGDWHSFAWGESVVFNNGIDVPQILEPGASNFIDLPNWGLLTSGQQLVTCKSLRAFNNTMVACNITINGTVKPNMVWWSAPGVIANNDADFFQPSWDYEDISTLSGFNYVGVTDGEIIDSLTLDTSHMIYLRGSTYAMNLVGGTFVYAFRRALEYGCAQLGAVAEYNNFHFVVAPATVYIHDGSTVRQIANARVEETFVAALQQFDDLRCTHDVGNKEIHTLYINKTNGRKQYLIYNYEDDTFSFGEAFCEDPADTANFVVCMAYGLKVDPGGGSWDANTETWETIGGSWADADPAADVRIMYWLLGNKLMFAESDAVNLCPWKKYYVRSGRLSFTESGDQFTTDKAVTLMNIYPHIEGQANTQFTIFGSENLGSAIVQKEVQNFDPNADYKVDTRATSRYTILEIEVTAGGFWEMFSMDYDVDDEYAR